MCKFSSDMKAKLGNTIAYIVSNVSNPSKTKILKILYLMEEEMVRRHGVPFLCLPFEVWKMGPVQKDVFVDLSDGGTMLEDYVEQEYRDGSMVFKSKVAFDEDEFSDAELSMMKDIVSLYGKKSAAQLVAYLHKKESLWYKTAAENGLIDDFKKGLRNNSPFCIDFRSLISGKQVEGYNDSVDIHSAANSMKALAHV